jgi:capsule polysaccharide modification protein KpsS
LGIRCIISKQVDKLDYYDEIIDKYSNQEQKSVEELKDYLKAYSKLTSNFKSGYRASISKKVKSSVRYLLVVCNDEYRKYYVNYGRTRTKILTTETSLFFKKIFREFFINKHFVKEIDTIKTSFIYFPLHLDPEQSTLMGAPYYTDQLNVIINISRSLPVEYSLVVKEHPAQVLNSWRDVSYYKTLMNLPNVKLLHPSVSNDEILKRCSLVITIAGTLGLEAAFYGKPSITFTDVIYSGLPSVYRLQSLEELPQSIRNSLKNSSDIKNLNKFVSCVVDNSIEYDYVNLEIASQHRFFKGGFYFEYEIPVKKGIDFIEENKEIFDKLATEYVKKIIEHKQHSSKNL